MNLHAEAISLVFGANIVLGVLLFLIVVSVRFISRIFKKQTRSAIKCYKIFKLIFLLVLGLMILELSILSFVSYRDIYKLRQDIRLSDRIKVAVLCVDTETKKEFFKEYWLGDTDALTDCSEVFEKNDLKLFLLPSGVGFNTNKLIEIYLYEDQRQIRVFYLVGEVLVLKKGCIYYAAPDLRSEIQKIMGENIKERTR